MTLSNPLLFISDIGQLKMENSGFSSGCPFCDRSNLQEILAEDGPILLVKNKYPTLADSYQTVLIETDDCEADFSSYPKEHLYRLIRFGVENWLKMENSGVFASVIFFKNHGLLSGGSVSHEHMQIIGLKYLDYRKNLVPENFTGIIICKDGPAEFNLSTQPLIGFYEFNVVLKDLAGLSQMADYIQTAVHYLLKHFKNCTSYNIFFYSFGKKICAKIVPRFVTSPLFIGYALPQVSDRAEKVVKSIQQLYF